MQCAEILGPSSQAVSFVDYLSPAILTGGFGGKGDQLIRWESRIVIGSLRREQKVRIFVTFGDRIYSCCLGMVKLYSFTISWTASETAYSSSMSYP